MTARQTILLFFTQVVNSKVDLVALIGLLALVHGNPDAGIAY